MSTDVKAAPRGAKVPADAGFCPHCGSAAAEGDLFCRSCGTSLSQSPAPPPVPDAGSNGSSNGAPTVEQASPAGRGRKVLLGVGLAALAAAVAAGVLIAGGVVSLGSDEAASPGEKRAVESAMADRDQFLSHERTYLGAYGQALTELRRYQREEREFRSETERIEEEFADEFDACYRYFDVACPEPDYPDAPKAPNFSAETKDIRAAAQDFEELRVTLSSSSRRGAAGRLNAQLIAATEAAKAEAEHNADVFDEAVQPAEEDSTGTVDKGKIKTLRRETALPSIRAMNQAAVRALRAVGLSLSRFDVPGGRDLDAKDHSDEL